MIGIAELHEWVNGLGTRKQHAREITLLHARPSEHQLSLADIEWDPETLRQQLQLMLIFNELAPLDLLRSWGGPSKEDSPSKDGGRLSFKEFLRMMKRLVRPGEEDLVLWDADIRPAVQLAFRSIAGSDRSINVVEFERWLNKGWKEANDLAKRQKAGKLSPALKRTTSAVRSVAMLRAAARPRKPPVPSPPPRAAPAAEPERKPDVPPGADRKTGWQARQFLTKIAKISAVPRPAYDQRRLLDQAQHELRRLQLPQPRSEDDLWRKYLEK